MRGTRVLIGMAAVLFSGVTAAHAQDQDPSSRVARTSFLQGEVSFRPGTVDDWTSATLNYPLTSGDHLWTDVDARAELHIGPNAIRLAPQTAFEILELDDNHLQIRLTQGSALIHMRTLDVDDDVEIDTPTGAVTLLRDGTYRVDVSADGATSTVTARNGDAEVSANDGAVEVHPYETVLFTSDGASRDVRDAPPMDEYDQWAVARDRADDESVSARYVSREMTGYEDLDRNGTWSDDAEYGHVWAPTYVVADWAPYRYGRWVWVEPYGWTWIDDAPWGFAPFHYGRWAYARNHWVWVPGSVRRRPVYAPALVVFVGGNDYRDRRWDGRRNVEWFPLAPNEVYRPAYHASDRYVRRVNVTNVNVTNINVTNINVTNINYRNQRVNGAVTAVSQDEFAGSRRIGRGATVVPVEQARYAHVVGHGAPVAPTEQSVLIRRRDAAPVSRPPEAVQNRPVVWRNTPPARPATFASHENQLRSTGDTPVEPLPISQTRGAPRVAATRPISHTDGPATPDHPANNGDTHAVTPNTDARRVPNTRPNINVRQYPAAQAQPVYNASPRVAPKGNGDSDVRRVPNVQPSVSERPAAEPRPNVNVRAAQVEQPNVNVRPAEAEQPMVKERPSRERPMPRARPTQTPREVPAAPADAQPVSHSDVQPNERPVSHPNVQSNERPASRSDVQPNERPVNERSVKPARPPRAEAEPAPRNADDHSANGRRRGQDDENDKGKAKPDENDKPPHRG